MFQNRTKLNVKLDTKHSPTNRSNEMNIFVLSKNPKEAALFHCNKHVVKMILEYTQLLFTLIWCRLPLLLSEENVVDSSGNKIKIYKSTHINHPCSIWLRESKSNAFWLLDLLEHCCKEYTKRYHKTHSCQVYIHFFRTVLPLLITPNTGLTEFKLCMPEEYKVKSDAVASYRNYYFLEKRLKFNVVWFDGQRNELVPTWYFEKEQQLK